MAFDITSVLELLGFTQILVWLLSFAIIYGILSHVGEKGIPKSVAARAIIAIVVSFLVLLAAPTQLAGVLEKMSAGLILTVIGILVLIIFLEVAGIKTKGKLLHITKEGERVHEHKDPMSYLQYHGKLFAAIFIIIAILIFIGAGGLELLGWEISLGSTSIMAIVFFIVVLISIFWMISSKE